MHFSLRIGLLCMVFMTSCQLGESIEGGEDSIPAVERVNRLGKPDNEDTKDIEILALNPRESAALLISQLHTLSDSESSERADARAMEHVLWLIRALRFITGGLDFCAPTKHVFSHSEEEQNRKYWLGFAHGKCLTFFGYWPSRDRSYVAPPDTQRSIIALWQHWDNVSGETFSYKPLRDPKPQEWVW